jgi:hypothetical protein
VLLHGRRGSAVFGVCVRAGGSRRALRRRGRFLRDGAVLRLPGPEVCDGFRLGNCLPAALLAERRLRIGLLQCVHGRVSRFHLLQLRRRGRDVRGQRAELLPGDHVPQFLGRRRPVCLLRNLHREFGLCDWVLQHVIRRLSGFQFLRVPRGGSGVYGRSSCLLLRHDVRRLRAGRRRPVCLLRELREPKRLFERLLFASVAR